MVPLNTTAIHYVSADAGVLCDMTFVLGDTVQRLKCYGIS
jgi:hypothetical protein